MLAATGDLLVLERVAGSPDWAGLGRAVARLHRTTGPRFGWHRDNSGGRITQHNGWHDRWNDFYVANRVRVHLADPVVPDAGAVAWSAPAPGRCRRCSPSARPCR